MKKKITYKIEKSLEEGWNIIRTSQTKRGISIGKVFNGTKVECEERIIQLRKEV